MGGHVNGVSNLATFFASVSLASAALYFGGVHNKSSRGGPTLLRGGEVKQVTIYLTDDHGHGFLALN